MYYRQYTYIATVNNIIQSGVDVCLLFPLSPLPSLLGLLRRRPFQDSDIICIGLWMCFKFMWFSSSLDDLSIHLIKTSFFHRGMFYTSNQLPLEKISHIQILFYLALTRACHACVHACACKRGVTFNHHCTCIRIHVGIARSLIQRVHLAARSTLKTSHTSTQV